MQTVNGVSRQPKFWLAFPNWLTTVRVYLLTVVSAHLIWETAQLPLYTIWQSGSLGANVFAVMHCTGGDVLIALAALAIGLLLAGDRNWPHRRFAIVATITLMSGFGYTVFSEWLNVVVRKTWAYSDLMPVISIFGLNFGISPLLQWIFIPTLALYASRRAGKTPGRDTEAGLQIWKHNAAAKERK